jgi:hypothetical protein
VRRTLGAVLLALTGHGATVGVVLAAVAAARADAGGDLDAGGNFAVSYAALCLLAVGQVLLFTAVAWLAGRGATGWQTGLWTGWATGLGLLGLWMLTG